MSSRNPSVMLAAILLLAACRPAAEEAPAEAAAPTVDVDAHRAEVDAWHAAREERLRQPTGWLSLVGLEWLEAGENPMGSAPDAAVRFPPEAPERLGTLRLENGSVTLLPAPGAELSVEGQEISAPRPLASDATGAPTEVEAGRYVFYVIERGDRFAVRIKDTESPLIASFQGIERYPVDPAWRVDARFEPYPAGRTVKVPDIIGTVNEEPSPGRVVFTHDGRESSLDALEGPEGTLFLVFGDTTNNETTYGGGRFVYTEAPRGGRVVVDFNQAYNPPCVFTPFATCPLPPPGNDLPYAVEAGEKMWGEHHAPAGG